LSQVFSPKRKEPALACIFSNVKKKNKEKETFCIFTKYTILAWVSFLFSFVYLFHDFKVISILNVYDFMSLKVF
jgi:hypothetical protein